MDGILARDLRNHTADILRRVEADEQIEIYRSTQTIAKIVPLRGRRRWIPGSELISQLERLGPDRTGLADEVRETVDETTDDLRL